MVREYVSLQLRILQRRFQSWGLPFEIGILSFILLFSGISYYFFSKTDLASVIYPFIALSFVHGMNDRRRIDYLKNIFSKRKLNKIRLIENGLISFPFNLFLLVKGFYVQSVILFIASVLMAFVSMNVRIGKTIATPFGKIPFEFPIGFRKTFILIFFLYAIAFIAIRVDNFNLGAFSLFAVFLVVMSYYYSLEPVFYVWNYSLSARDFLFHKIKQGVTGTLLLAIPVFMILAIDKPQNIGLCLLIVLLGMVYLTATILSKYTSYPREMTIPNGIIFGLSIFFPPVILFSLPIFYRRSLHSLKRVLLS